MDTVWLGDDWTGWRAGSGLDGAERVHGVSVLAKFWTVVGYSVDLLWNVTSSILEPSKLIEKEDVTLLLSSENEEMLEVWDIVSVVVNGTSTLTSSSVWDLVAVGGEVGGDTLCLKGNIFS